MLVTSYGFLTDVRPRGGVMGNRACSRMLLVRARSIPRRKRVFVERNRYAVDGLARPNSRIRFRWIRPLAGGSSISQSRQEVLVGYMPPPPITRSTHFQGRGHRQAGPPIGSQKSAEGKPICVIIPSRPGLPDCNGCAGLRIIGRHTEPFSRARSKVSM